MVLPHDVCSHIQNAFRARHAKVAVNHSSQNLGILTILLRAGFISNLTRGTVDGPDPLAFHEAGSDARRHIWADLKYREDRPVLRHMGLVSKPSKRVVMEPAEIRLLCSGRRAQKISPLGMGEIAIVHTNNRENEWLEAREALQLKLGGEVVARAG